MVSGSGLADSVEKFGPCGTMALPVFGSAEEVNRAAEEEGDGGDVGFGFGDGYDLVAFETGLAERLLKRVSGKSTVIASTVEADAVKVI